MTEEEEEKEDRHTQLFAMTSEIQEQARVSEYFPSRECVALIRRRHEAATYLAQLERAEGRTKEGTVHTRTSYFVIRDAEITEC